MPDYETIEIPLALNGLNKDLEAIDLELASPNLKNMIIEKSRLRKRLGYSPLGVNLPLQGIGMELIQYTDARGTVHHIALTSTLAYEYDSSTLQWKPIVADTQMQDCEAHAEFTGGSDITVATDATNYKEGSGSLKMTAGDDIAAGANIAYTTTFDDSADLSTYGATSYITFWFRASKAGVQITLHIKDADTDEEVLSFAAPLADTWYHMTRLLDASGITTATRIEIDTETALVDTDIINVDDIRICGSFTGAVDNRWSHTLATDVNLFSNNGGTALVISNGVDKPLYYEGQASDAFQELGTDETFASFANVKEIIEFWNHLFFINYNNGAQNVRNLAYADFGDVDDWSGGTSGSSLLTDTRGALVRAKKFGSDLILYSDQSITVGRYVGGTVLYVFPTLVFESGLFAPKAIWDFVDMHFFVGTDQKIYGYTGGRQLMPIGDAIEESLFEEMDVSKKAKMVTGLDPARHKLNFFFASPSDTYAQRSYSLNYKRRPMSWEYHVFADSVRDFSVFSNATDWYFDGPEVEDEYCDEVSMFFDDSYTQTGHALAVFLSGDGYVFMLDELTGQDDDADIECIYDTPNLTVDKLEHKMRVFWFSFNALSTIASSTVKVEYSVDEGDNWTEFDDSPISLNAAWAQHRMALDKVDRQMMFRCSQNSAGDFQLRKTHYCRQIQTDRD